MMTPTFRKTLTACALLAFEAPALKAAVIIDANFNTGTFANVGLVDYSTQGDSSMTVVTTATTFSMFGRFNTTATQNTGSAMSFGWTKASEPFRTFQGNNTGSTTSPRQTSQRLTSHLLPT